MLIMLEKHEKAVVAEIAEIMRKNGMTLANLPDVVAGVEIYLAGNNVTLGDVADGNVADVEMGASLNETITLQVNSSYLEKIIREEARALLIEAQEKNKNSSGDSESKYMTRMEFIKYTKMAWNTIQKDFFFNKDFVPFRTLVNNKWRFDRVEATEYFDSWLKANKLA